MLLKVSLNHFQENKIKIMARTVEFAFC